MSSANAFKLDWSQILPFGNELKNVQVKSLISERSIIEVTSRLFVCNLSKTHISIFLTPCEMFQCNLILAHLLSKSITLHTSGFEVCHETNIIVCQ